MYLASVPNFRRCAMAMLLIVLGAGTLIPRLCAQTFRVIHYFTPQAYSPTDGLVADAAGNLYGSTLLGGTTDAGTVFRIMLRNSSWLYTPIYNFQGGNDGASPYATPIFGPDGALYGTTGFGGSNTNCPSGCGTVYKLFPPPTFCTTALCSWSDKVIYGFASQTPHDGFLPESRVSFDSHGNLYGSTYEGGNLPLASFGTIFQLIPSNGVWSEGILYTFAGMGTGNNPSTGVIVDSTGNLYAANGAAYICGFHQACGAVIELQYPSWNVLYTYAFDQSGDGTSPEGAPIWDAEGNMYGTTSQGSLDGSNGPTIWELSPSSGSWLRTTLYTWPVGAPGGRGSLTMDADGNLYGVQAVYGQGQGSVFKLTNRSGIWTYSTLHAFTGNDGSYPNGGVIVDGHGDVFGTTTYGGQISPRCGIGCGVVFEIIP
jgi:uncharacterized repeat protein (TIGR03803 family)